MPRNLLEELCGLEPLVGNTPCLRLRSDAGELAAKVEAYQLSGSAKVRPAYFILAEAIRAQQLKEGITVVESTSGNFGIALAHLCSRLGLEFVPIIDPNIPAEKEALLRTLCRRVIRVTEMDPVGGYLATRLSRLREILREEPDTYHPNQYENLNNCRSYHRLADEIVAQVPNVKRVFVAVSSGGCIAGLSMRIKERNPAIEIVAVDVEGSRVFQNVQKPRRISGIGAGLRGCLLNFALIDRVVILSEREIIDGARNLAREQGILLGASSGAVYAAARNSAFKSGSEGCTVLVCPDDGRDYIRSIYNDGWAQG
jgi:N-(2-amino-2-carboxyethyl)-L-glutamate synthase